MLAEQSPEDPLAQRAMLRRALFAAILIASVVPKIAFLLFRGELWADEINLALNIGPRGLLEMGRPFLHLQVAPWGSMVAIKAFVSVLGESATTYRLVPLLAAIVVVALSYPLGRRLAGPTAGFAAMAVTGLTTELTYYSAELKPYSLDAAVAAALTLLCLRVLDAPEDRRAWNLLLGAGVVAGWVSLPSLFVLGGCGLALVVGAWLRTKSLGEVARLAGPGALWVGSFALHYQIFIAGSSTATNKNVAKYWSDGFAPFPPTTLAELKWYPGKFFYFFENPGALSFRYFAGVIFLFGVGWLVTRRKQAHAVALVLPLLLAILASAMGKYASVGRLMLFALPGMMVVVAIGAVTLARYARAARIPVAVALILVLIGPRLGETYDKVLDPVAPREIQHLMADLAPLRQEGDTIYLAGAGLATLWGYHADRIGLPNEYIGVGDLRYFDADGRFPQLREVAQKTFGLERLWLIAEARSFGGDPERLGRSVEPVSAFLTRFYDKWGGKGRLVSEADDLSLYFYDLSEARLPDGPEATENPAP